MENYKDKFTPEQLEKLHYYFFEYNWEKPLDFEDEIDEDPLTDEIRSILIRLFNKELPTPPDDITTEDDYYTWVGEAYGDFVTAVLTEIFKDEDEKPKNSTREVARIIYDRDTHLTNITHKDMAKKHRQVIAGQLQFVSDLKGNLTIVADDDLNLSDALAKRNTFANINGELLDAIGTGVEEKYKQGHRGEFRIRRKNFEEYLNVELPAPPPDVLDFIVRDGMTAPEEKLTEEEKKLKKRISKHYSYWEEITKLDHAGMLKTPTGTYKALVFKGYDKQTDDIILESPYYENVFKYLENNKIQSTTKKDDKPIYSIEQVAHIRKGSINSVRNKATVETVNIIIERLFQQNKQASAKKNPNYKYKDKKGIKLDIGYGDLMRNNNKLLYQLYTTDDNGQLKEVSSASKRKILERVIFGNEKTQYYVTKTTRRDGETEEYKQGITYLEYVINEHTVIKDYFHNFSIKCDPISLNSIKKNPRKYGIHIRHEGLNGEYHDNPLLLPPVIE